MTSSRKLLIAALFVAGGYAAALLVGRGSEPFLASGDSPPVGAQEDGWLAGLKNVFAGDDRPANVGQLVPDAVADLGPARGTPSSRSTPAPAPRQLDAPIWLTATSESGSAVALASQPNHAEAPPTRLAEPPPALPALPTQTIVEASPPVPQARITNVVAAGSDTTRREASTWDRWPRWNSDEAASAKGPVAATFQETSTAGAGMVPVTFNAALVARNSPQRDTGPETEPTGRTHIVVDGDSLEKLAARYLDDPTLGGEIYRINRDVLASPDLLPIGVELQIPDDRVADSQRGLPNAQLASSDSRPANNMVPVDWSPRPFEGPPRAELLRPIAPARSD